MTAVLTKERILAFAFAWADLLVEVDGDAIVFAEGAVRPLLGLTGEQLAGTKLTDIFATADRILVDKLCTLLQRHGRMDEAELRLQNRAGGRIPVKVCGHSLGGQGTRHFFLGIRTQLRMPGDDAACERDADSGLYSAEKFHELAAGRLKEMAGKEVDIAVLDVTGLERVCASLPDEDRETLLNAIGTLVKANSIDGDSAAAMSGGKFSFLADHGQNVASLEKEVVDLVAALAPNKEVIVSTATAAVGETGGVDEDSLAKGLMYTFQRIQTQGGSALLDMTTNMTSLVDQTVGQITAFRDLVTNRAFDVALHPIVNIKSGKIHHFEALCRFHNSGKDASPFQVITFAEETGMIDKFDLTMAVKVVEWLKHQPRNNDSYRAAVNVSGYSIGQKTYVDALFTLLERNDWLEHRLIFEITESSRMTDLEGANEFIQALRKRGHEVCLDDFGAGAASFQYLSVLDVDVVKLDGSAVKNAQKAEKGRAFLSALTDLCKKLKVETVAEMVDSPKALEFVRDCGCDYVQGYLFGKPSTNVADFFPLPNESLLWSANKFR